MTEHRSQVRTVLAATGLLAAMLLAPMPAARAQSARRTRKPRCISRLKRRVPWARMRRSWPRSCRTRSATSTDFRFRTTPTSTTARKRGTQDILNIQPVIPIHVTDEWNVITRTILPLFWQPSLQPVQTGPFGTGPTTFSAFLSPKNPVNGLVWGVGRVIKIGGKLPINLSFGAHYNAVRPQYGATWQLHTQLTVIF